MNLRSSATLGMATALLIVACGGGGATTRPATAAPPTAALPTTAAATPTTAAATPTAAGQATPTAAVATDALPTVLPSNLGPGSEPPLGDWVVGVVTDVGTVDDKNFNQYSFEGASSGAADIGAEEPGVAVPADASQYASLIQQFVDTGHNIIVTVGFNLTNDTIVAAKDNPEVWFVGVDQAPCIDETGAPDTTFACAGDPKALIPNFVGLQYQEDQAGYLAGMIAATVSQNGTVGAIGGISLVPAVVRYIQGFELGAKSINPEITVVTDYVSTSDFGVAFNDPGAGKTFGDQFIATNEPDVLFQVAGKTGNGVLEAACESDIIGIGVDVDQWLSLSADTDPTYDCILTSAEKHLSSSVQDTINAIADGTLETAGGVLQFNATNDGIGVSPDHSDSGLITTELQGLINDALIGMEDGSVVTCPENCGSAE
jgi:basic membrane protein A